MWKVSVISVDGETELSQDVNNFPNPPERRLFKPTLKLS